MDCGQPHTHKRAICLISFLISLFSRPSFLLPFRRFASIFPSFFVRVHLWGLQIGSGLVLTQSSFFPISCSRFDIYGIRKNFFRPKLGKQEPEQIYRILEIWKKLTVQRMKINFFSSFLQIASILVGTEIECHNMRESNCHTHHKNHETCQ